jgi:serine protease Do
VKPIAGVMLTIALAVSPASGGGYERPIDALLPRVVKLYGLAAGAQPGYGTGVIVSADGLVLTVFSLLIDARQIRAVTADGTLHDAEVVRRDPQRQLALLRLRSAGQDGASASEGGGAESFPYFDLACDDPDAPGVRAGDWVVIAGNPFKVAEGAEPMSVAHGIISARTRLDARRSFRDFPYRGDVLAIDAITSNPGGPGSAVVDLDGRFVGMVGREVVSNLTHTHFNYAMPRDVLCEFYREASGQAPPGGLTPAAVDGQVQPIDPGIRLVRTGYRKLPPMVERVRRGSPAERAGVRPDDLILSVNGKSVGDATEYDERLRTLTSGEAVDLVIRRGRSVLSFRLEPEKSP